MSTLLTAPFRKHVYAAYAVLGLVLGSTQVAFAAAETGQPAWLTVALAVYAYIGGALGFTARAHTPEADTTGGPVTEGEAQLIDDIRAVEGRRG